LTQQVTPAMNKDLLLYKTLIHTMSDAVLVEDENRCITITNQAFCDLFSLPVSANSIIGCHCSHTSDETKHLFVEPEQFVERIDQILQEKIPIRNEFIEMANGTKLERDYIPVFEEENYFGHLWVYKNQTHHYLLEQQLLGVQEQLQKQYLIDPLTGICNHQCFHKRIAKEVARAKRFNQELSIITLSINDFISLNKQLGQEKGQQILKEFALFLNSHARGQDSVVRLSGAEFILILPNTRPDEALHFCQRISELVNSAPIMNTHVSFSAGISALSMSEEVDTLVQYAETAMYQVENNNEGVAIYTE